MTSSYVATTGNYASRDDVDDTPRSSEAVSDDKKGKSLPPKLVAGGVRRVGKHVDSVTIASKLEGWRGSGLDLDPGGE